MAKQKRNEYDYGECEICDTPMVEKRIKQDFWIRGQLIVVENVPLEFVRNVAGKS